MTTTINDSQRSKRLLSRLFGSLAAGAFVAFLMVAVIGMIYPTVISHTGAKIVCSDEVTQYSDSPQPSPGDPITSREWYCQDDRGQRRDITYMAAAATFVFFTVGGGLFFFLAGGISALVRGGNGRPKASSLVQQVPYETISTSSVVVFVVLLSGCIAIVVWCIVRIAANGSTVETGEDAEIVIAFAQEGRDAMADAQDATTFSMVVPETQGSPEALLYSDRLTRHGEVPGAVLADQSGNLLEVEAAQ